MSDTIRIELPYLADGLNDQVRITRTAARVGAAIVDVYDDGTSYAIAFPSERAARSFLRTAFPDHDPADINAIVAAKNSITY